MNTAWVDIEVNYILQEVKAKIWNAKFQRDMRSFL